ncbi:MAG: 2'-deoxycytidine 5'-triphosphate deaminase [Kiloniellaceae bacterium]
MDVESLGSVPVAAPGSRPGSVQEAAGRAREEFGSSTAIRGTASWNESNETGSAEGSAATMNESAIQAVLPIIGEARERFSGILPAQEIKNLIDRGEINALGDIPSAQIQPASLDLRLGDVAYRVPASFLPGKQCKVEEKVLALADARIDLTAGAILETGQVYIARLQENLRLRKRHSAIANPKSSTGRIDVFARLITDFGTEFDNIRERYCGPLWAEIAPRSFNVRVRSGSRLVQIRIKRGTPPSNETFLRRLDSELRLVRAEGRAADIKDGGYVITVDIVGDPVSRVIGYKAKSTSKIIDVDRRNFYDPLEFWEPVYRPDAPGIILAPDDFHILASNELIAVPSDFAADMVPYDTLVGEFRVHYAGFFDPGFGYVDGGPVGTRAVLEVRSHEVPFMIEHGQVVGRLMVDTLTQASEKSYGAAIGSSYHRQDLTLSKHFKRAAL